MQKPKCCIGSIRDNIFFDSHGYYRKNCQFSFTENFGDIRDRWNGFSSLAGLDTKIWGPQQKPSAMTYASLLLYGNNSHAEDTIAKYRGGEHDAQKLFWTELWIHKQHTKRKVRLTSSLFIEK